MLVLTSLILQSSGNPNPNILESRCYCYRDVKTMLVEDDYHSTKRLEYFGCARNVARMALNFSTVYRLSGPLPLLSALNFIWRLSEFLIQPRDGYWEPLKALIIDQNLNIQCQKSVKQQLFTTKAAIL